MARDEREGTGELGDFSARVPEAVFEQIAGLEDAAIRVVLVLCYQEERTPGGTVPLTVDQIARKAGLATVRTRKALGALLSARWVMQERGGRWLLAEPLPPVRPDRGSLGGEVGSEEDCLPGGAGH